MATVSIACKLPHGLFAQLYKMVEIPTGPVGQMTPTAQPEGKRVKLNGGNHHLAIAGWGVTENIDKAWADAWMAQNATLRPVEAGLIIVRESTQRLASEAKDKALMVSGFEALDPNKMPEGLKKVEKEQ